MPNTNQVCLFVGICVINYIHDIIHLVSNASQLYELNVIIAPVNTNRETNLINIFQFKDILVF